MDAESGTPYDYSALSADEGVHFLRSMDLLAEVVSNSDMNPRTWDIPEESHSVVHRRNDRRWAPDPAAPLLPTQHVEMPQVVHAIWLGSVPALDGASKVFWQNFRSSASIGRGQATFVLWTDVTRDELQGRSDEIDPDSPRARHLELLSVAAAEDDIVLVNVDEVYNAARAAPTTRLVQIERAKRSGAGWAAASDILRIQIVSDFGGMYVDGGDHVTTLRDLSATGVVASKSAFAVDYEEMPDGRVAYQNNALVAPPHHPLLDIHIEKLDEQYRLDQEQLYLGALRPPTEADDALRLKFKRHSVMYRTGLDLTGKVLESVGYSGTHVPRVRGLETARGTDGMSWLPGSEVRVRHDQTLSSGPATLAFTQDMVLTALRSLSLRGGDLDLFLLQDAIARHPRPDEIWEGVFEFLRSDDHLRPQVRAVTRSEEALVESLDVLDDHIASTHVGATVQLPGRVLEMLELLPGPPTVRMGRLSEPVRLRPSQRRANPGSSAGVPQVLDTAQRPLPAPPERVAEFRWEHRRLRTVAQDASPAVADTQRPWPLIDRAVAGVTTRPSINQNVLEGADDLVLAEAERFLGERFPMLGHLNPTRGTENCNQAVVAVDHMLDGRPDVRIPPTGPSFYGMELLQQRHKGTFVLVESYDEVIDRIRERPGSRGVVYVGWEDRGHLFNVVDTEDAVVFLDGQVGSLAVLPQDAAWIGLMRYQPEPAAAPETVESRPLSHDPVGAVHQFYASRAEALLTQSPVDAPALFTLLWRQSTVAEDQETVAEIFHHAAGSSLAGLVDVAVAEGRLSPPAARHVEMIMTRPTGPGTRATNDELARPYEHAAGIALATAEFFRDADRVDWVLGQLAALDRDLNALANIRRAWGELDTSTSLEDELVRRWPDYEHVFYDLLGHADSSPVPFDQLREWYRRLPFTTFEHVEHGTVPVAAEHPEDGCDLRSLHWSAQLLRWGAEPRQVFAASAVLRRPTVTTPYARGARHDAPVTLEWFYHTAPVVPGQLDDGRIVPVVLDPALDRGPLLLEEWTEAMAVPADARYIEKELLDAHADFVRERAADAASWEGDYPVRHTVLLTDGYTGSFPRPDTSQTELMRSWDEANHAVRAEDDRLQRHWVRMVRRNLARSLWSLMQSADTADEAALDGLLGDMYRTVQRYGPLRGFLEGNVDVAWAAHDLLGVDRYAQFASLFPTVPQDEILVDDISVSGSPVDETEQDTLSPITQGMQSLDLGDGAHNDHAGLRELAPASPVDGTFVAQRPDAQATENPQTVRFDARRYQLPSGEWVSEASVRLRVQQGPGVGVEDVRYFADELAAAVRQQVNDLGPRLPGGDLFHLHVAVGDQLHAAHAAATVQDPAGSETGRAAIDQAVHDITRMVVGTDRDPGDVSSGGSSLSAEDLAVIWQAFESRPEAQDSPHPLAPRTDRQGQSIPAPRTPHVVTDQDGTQWASGSRSARDAQGNVIPDSERACVEVAVVARA
nr:hypothetical protein GCM10025730_22060 [Promicromonospora thailandica]